MNTEDSKKKDESDYYSVTKRLDVLIRLLIEINLNKKDRFTLTQFVKSMKSTGLDRKEIASILGKKPTDIDPLLYTGKKLEIKEDTDDNEVRENV